MARHLRRTRPRRELERHTHEGPRNDRVLDAGVGPHMDSYVLRHLAILADHNSLAPHPAPDASILIPLTIQYWCRRWLTLTREEIREVRTVEEHVKVVVYLHDPITLRKYRPSYTSSFLRNTIDGLWLQ
jgi:hypothetical protein